MALGDVRQPLALGGPGCLAAGAGRHRRGDQASPAWHTRRLRGAVAAADRGRVAACREAVLKNACARPSRRRRVVARRAGTTGGHARPPSRGRRARARTTGGGASGRGDGRPGRAGDVAGSAGRTGRGGGLVAGVRAVALHAQPGVSQRAGGAARRSPGRTDR